MVEWAKAEKGFFCLYVFGVKFYRINLKISIIMI